METNKEQSRKWLLTINNPEKHGETHDVLIEKLKMFMPLYFCLCDEIGEQGTYHTHIYIKSASPIRFNTVKKRFETAHIDKAYGTARQNKDYITKQNNWAETEKATTNLPETFFEWGTIPDEKADSRAIFATILSEVKEGKSTNQIINEMPSLIFKIKDINILQETVRAETGNKFRDVKTTYIWGKTGTGKTSYVFNNHPIEEICRIITYRKSGINFDNYNGQNVLVFEEYHSQIPITDMLSYLDRYPLTLPARYNDRTAQYTYVYILSNIPIEDQYKDIQKDKPEVWKAFLRRIDRIIEIKNGGVIKEIKKKGTKKNENKNSKVNNDD